jgi:hypothetical protein
MYTYVCSLTALKARQKNRSSQKMTFLRLLQHCGCPLRAGEVNLKNLRWTLPDLGAIKAVVKVMFKDLP